jgi:hypothetical protein
MGAHLAGNELLPARADQWLVARVSGGDDEHNEQRVLPVRLERTVVNGLIPLHMLGNHCPPGEWQAIAKQWLDQYGQEPEPPKRVPLLLLPMREVKAGHIQNVIDYSATLAEAAKILKVNPATLWRRRKKSERTMAHHE